MHTQVLARTAWSRPPSRPICRVVGVMACAVWPEDGKPYIYSNLEPFECHRILPCFDQPDLKAVLALTVTAPADWVVVANAADESKKTETVSVRVCVCGVRLVCVSVWGGGVWVWSDPSLMLAC